MSMPLPFEHPVQTIPSVSEASGISRFTLVQAAQRGDFGADAYKSGGTWLVNTTGPQFQHWLATHATTPRVKGRLAREQRRDENEQTHPTQRAKSGDILAVRLFDGSEALVEVIGAATIMEYPGYSKKLIRVTVLKPTGPYGTLWDLDPMGKKSFSYEYTLPVVSDPTYGQDWLVKPLNTFRILTWEELQPLTIIPLYRDLDAKCGAEYAKYEYEADQGLFVAARLFLRNAGYTISPALKEKERFQVTRSTDYEHFQVWTLEERFGQAKLWTCQQLVAEALRLREGYRVPEVLELIA